MVPVAPEQSAPPSDGIEIGTRPLAPPKVSPLCEDESEHGENCLEDAVARVVREVESLRKSGAFPSLESFEDINGKRDAYLGPTMESNWVLPGKLLVGAYPASMNDSHHAHLLCTILLQGVSTFICLQQEYKAHGVTEAMWRSGEALRPYFQDVLQLLRKLQELREADQQAVPAVSAPDTTDFVHFPIVDCNVADDTKVLQLAAQLSMRVATGEVLYLHCWGGHGRTGTVVSIMLHLMYGLGAEEAMKRCQHVHDVRRIPISVGSPQTEAQREQVRRVISRLSRRLAAQVSRPATAPPPVSKSGSRNSRTSGSAGVIQRFSKTKADGAKSVTAKSVAKTESHKSIPAQGKLCGIVNRKCVSNEGVHAIEAGMSRQSSQAAVVGGRRGWVRGRREAFSPAPNGVGEELPGSLPSEEPSFSPRVSMTANDVGKCKEDDAATAPLVCPGVCDDESGPEEDGVTEASTAPNKSMGRRLRPRTSSWRENETDGVLFCAPATMPQQQQKSAAAAPGEVASGSTSGRARRKSFTDTPSLGEEAETSRGARSNRLRRKSAPGQSPRSAERDFYHSNEVNSDGKEDEEQQKLAQAGPVAPGLELTMPKELCTGAERCAAQSGGGTAEITSENRPQ